MKFVCRNQKYFTLIIATIMMISGIFIVSLNSLSNPDTAGETSGLCGVNLTWSYDSSTETLTITGTGAMSDYEIFDHSRSTAPWHSYMYKMKTLFLPDGLTKIGNYAFYNCSGFTGTLAIPSSVTTIGNSAFCNCSGFTGTLAIPENVKTIGNSAFCNCSGFTGTLTIPSNVETIGGSVFSECSGFTGSLTIPSSVTYIESYAFYDCSGFTGSLTIPSSVTYIGSRAFYNCSGFTGSLTIPSSVTYIGSYAFCNCSGFTGTLTISESVTRLEDFTFYSCSGFTESLVIPSSVTNIGDNVFDYCIGLTGSLTISEGVTSIGFQAFQSCRGLTGTLSIPSSVTSIGGRAFYDCNGSGFTVSINNPDYCSVNGILFSKDVETLIVCPTGLTGTLSIPSSVTNISDYAFHNCSGFTGSLVIPENVTSIGQYAFDEYSRFTSITIPSSVTWLYLAFSGASFYAEDEFTILSPTVKNLAGYSFTGTWTKMVRNNSSTISYTLSIITDPVCGGTTTGAGIYVEGSSTTITAKPSEGYSFDGWYDGNTLVSKDQSFTFTVSSNVSYTAIFSIIEEDMPPYSSNNTSWTMIAIVIAAIIGALALGILSIKLWKSR